MKDKSKDYFCHSSSFIDDDVTIGKNTKIWHFSHIQSGAVIGEGCSLGQNVNIGNNVIIGNNVKIQNNVSVYEGVELQNYVFCGPSVVFTNIKCLGLSFLSEELNIMIKHLLRNLQALVPMQQLFAVLQLANTQ